MSWLSSHPLPAYYRESCLDFSAFSSALTVCLSSLNELNLIHSLENRYKYTAFFLKNEQNFLLILIEFICV